MRIINFLSLAMILSEILCCSDVFKIFKGEASNLDCEIPQQRAI